MMGSAPAWHEASKQHRLGCSKPCLVARTHTHPSQQVQYEFRSRRSSHVDWGDVNGVGAQGGAQVDDVRLLVRQQLPGDDLRPNPGRYFLCRMPKARYYPAAKRLCHEAMVGAAGRLRRHESGPQAQRAAEVTAVR